MAAESWTVGGVSVTSGAFTMLQLNADPPPARTNWLIAADSEAALLMRKPLRENRKITMRLRVLPQSSMDNAISQIGSLVDKLNAASDSDAGIPVVWAPNGSTKSATFTALNGEITGLPIGLSDLDYLWFQAQPILDLQLDCHPYAYGSEVSLGTATASTPFVTKEITTSGNGDVPGRGRLVVTDMATQSRRHVEWGLEGPLTYNASTSLLVDSDDMVTTGFAGSQSTLSGAYDPNASGNSVITATLYSTSQPTALCGTGNLSHVGTFRVRARVHGGNPGDLVRLSWKALDGPLSANPWATLQQNGLWEEVDLGTIIIPTALSGTQRWTGQIEALPVLSGSSLTVDYLTLIPQSDGYGKARAVYSYKPGVVSGFDDFTGTTAGANLSGRTAPLGGTWATSGDTGDFVFADSNFSATSEELKRGTGSATNGRFAILGSSTFTDTQVDVRVLHNVSGGTMTQAAVARYVDSSNYLRAEIDIDASPAMTATLKLTQVIASTPTSSPGVVFTYAPLTPYRLRLLAFVSGRAIAQIFTDDGALLGQAEFSTTALATGGTLASGKPGLWDFKSAAPADNRLYDDFTVAVPSAEPIALYSGRTMQVRYDDTIRDDSTGTYTGRPPSYNGSRFLVPVGTSRVLVKARRNDIDAGADDNVTDSTKIEVFYTPRYLVIPR